MTPHCAHTQVQEFAEYLGFDLIADRDLFWIADEAMNAPVEAPWSEITDEDGACRSELRPRTNALPRV